MVVATSCAIGQTKTLDCPLSWGQVFVYFILISISSSNSWLQCSESSGSYKTAEDRTPIKALGGPKVYSDFSSGQSSSNAIDLSVKKRQKRLTTITLSSTDDDDAAKTSLVQKLTYLQKSPRANTGNVNLNLQVLCLLGTGGYGKVFLVRSKDNLEKYYDGDSKSGGSGSSCSTESGIYSEPEPSKARRKRGREAIQYVRNSSAHHDLMSDSGRSDSLNYYALKVIKKNNVLKSHTDLRHLKMEQRILARVRVKRFSDLNFHQSQTMS